MNMISFLNGKIILKRDKFIILEVNNIGYKVFLSQQTLFKLPASPAIRGEPEIDFVNNGSPRGSIYTSSTSFMGIIAQNSEPPAVIEHFKPTDIS